jgi:hypothetical protein
MRVAVVVAGMLIPRRIPMLDDDAFPVMSSITPIATGESQGRYHHENGGGGFIASHWLFILKRRYRRTDKTTERREGVAKGNVNRRRVTPTQRR